MAKNNSEDGMHDVLTLVVIVKVTTSQKSFGISKVQPRIVEVVRVNLFLMMKGILHASINSQE
jgi:hypothetical protein